MIRTIDDRHKYKGPEMASPNATVLLQLRSYAMRWPLA